MLYIVATPIGNLEDITFRAIKVLKKVDLILAEDTRRAKILLAHYGIKEKEILSFFDHNKVYRTNQVIRWLQEGKEIALISEAGSPAISDPGFYLIRACQQKELAFTSLPGPSAVINGLILSGLPTDKFYFAGFIKRKKMARRKQFQEASSCLATLIFFESPYRLSASLEEMKEFFGNKPAAVVREMTKIYEEVKRDQLWRLAEYYRERKVKGEVSIFVDNR